MTKIPRKINSLEQNIKFKIEVGNTEIHFINISIKITGNNKFILDFYKKSTYRDVILPKDLYHPIQNNCIQDEENRIKVQS